MALRTCKECGKEISTKAKSCPACGSPNKQKSGCVFIALILLVFLFFSTSYLRDEVVKTDESTPTSISLGENSYQVGYEAGFVFGELRYHDQDPRLSESRLRIAASAGAEKRQAPETYLKAFIVGHEHGFTGKARGGRSQEPVPTFPIRIKRAPSLEMKDLGIIGGNQKSPYEELEALVKGNPTKDLLLIRAKYRHNDTTTEHLKFIYDRTERCFLKLSRTERAGSADSYRWALSIETPPEALAEEVLWGLDSKLRQFRSQLDKARATIPLRYSIRAEITEWP